MAAINATSISFNTLMKIFIMALFTVKNKNEMANIFFFPKKKHLIKLNYTRYEYQMRLS